MLRSTELRIDDRVTKTNDRACKQQQQHRQHQNKRRKKNQFMCTSHDMSAQNKCDYEVKERQRWFAFMQCLYVCVDGDAEH